MYIRRAVAACLWCFLSLCALRGSVAQELTWQETDFQTGFNPQTVTIAPHAILYRCGFKSSDKLTYNITSDIPLYSYAVDIKELKDVKFKGNKMSFSFERRSVCVNRTVCDMMTSVGRVIRFEKCFVLSNAGGSAPGTAVVQLKAKWDDKVLVIIVLCGALILGLLTVITCIIGRACACFSCNCCADCWYYNGRAKNKGYSPYTAPV